MGVMSKRFTIVYYALVAVLLVVLSYQAYSFIRLMSDSPDFGSQLVESSD